MYLLKFKLENNTEPYSIYECLNDEFRTFKRCIDEIKKEHANDRISLAIKNEIHTFGNVDEMNERCEWIELTHNEYEVFGKLRIGNGECAAKYIFDAVCHQKIHFEPQENMEMGM